MKIQISEFENYEIDFPDEVSIEQLSKVVFRLQQIIKLMDKDPINNGEERVRRRRRASIGWSREEIVEGLKILSSGSKEEKENWAMKYGRDWDSITKSLYYYKNRYGITSSELGGEGKIKNEAGSIKEEER